ncbi:hypothetical protein F3F96_06075 [Mariprofundus sp. NF]|uniref:hypothetical protein n=1 Tax=Mariprofundus sp. NF TaxID=2608716 RepID=UPI0015A4180E|nr:hypothetical protein [Mariprofundus sp. NF]NWF38697.1 hypothetical protein [Mariprofundus sp. NF]
METEQEQRREERLAAPELSIGKLCILETKRSLKVEGVRDITCAGIGLKVNGFLPQGELVRLKLNFGRDHFHLYGDVAWCVPAAGALLDADEPDLFMTGIIL